MAQQIGSYRIERELGQGGMATVYLAFDSLFERQVAIKVLPRQFTEDPRSLQRFEREAKTIAGLEDPAIVPVYDFGQDDGWPYLAMRYMSRGYAKRTYVRATDGSGGDRQHFEPPGAGAGSGA